MFVGSINADLRAIIAEMMESWRGREIYVGCSGNFTVERILAQGSVGAVHSNDVSLYSSALGYHLTGRRLEVRIADERYEWLAEYMGDGVPTIATLLLCTELFQHVDRTEIFHQRMAKALMSRFPAMHAQTVERVTKALDSVKVASFWPGDVVEFARQVPDDAVFVTFPPTYRGGYERMYKKMDEVFGWDKPDYVLFDDARFAELMGLAQAKAAWLTLRDEPVPDLESYCLAVVQTGMRSKPVYCYGGDGRRVITLPRQRTEAVPWSRLEGEAAGPLRLVRLTNPQLNTLRSEYLSPSISPAGAQVCIGVLVGDALAGAIAFSRDAYPGERWDVYMVSDFSIRPSVYKRLSKLVLAAAVSQEVKAIVEQSMNMPVETIGTTAFTDKPVSSKYRGIFHLYSRKEGKLNYVARAGQWTLEEGFRWWQANHAQT